MRQKLCVTLAVAVLALSEARETCKQFNGLRSLAAEWSGVWNTMLVYANVYAEGAQSRPAPKTLIASSHDPRRGGKDAVAGARRARTRVRQTTRAERDGSAELSIDLEELARVFAAQPGTERAAADKASKPRPRAAADAAGIAGAFHSHFDAESLRALAAGGKIEVRRLMSGELLRRERAGVERELARGGWVGARGRAEDRFVIKLADLHGAGAEALRAAEAAAETWPAGGVVEGPEGFAENEVFFTAPQTSSSGLLNCDAQPRR
ncbi:MAG: hypothetical protein LC800_16975 [Acidobacteria bacterium]|nr:hypothetical protein [Acidobacteriota bacterium]